MNLPLGNKIPALYLQCGVPDLTGQGWSAIRLRADRWTFYEAINFVWFGGKQRNIVLHWNNWYLFKVKMNGPKKGQHSMARSKSHAFLVFLLCERWWCRSVFLLLIKKNGLVRTLLKAAGVIVVLENIFNFWRWPCRFDKGERNQFDFHRWSLQGFGKIDKEMNLPRWIFPNVAILGHGKGKREKIERGTWMWF